MLACAPERGSSTPTFSAAPWARTIAGAASRDVEATMPALKLRRVRLVFGLRFIDFLPVTMRLVGSLVLFLRFSARCNALRPRYQVAGGVQSAAQPLGDIVDNDNRCRQQRCGIASRAREKSPWLTGGPRHD